MILSKHKAAQFRAKMTTDAGRQRRCHRFAVRSLPPLAAELHDVRGDRQILHHITRIAFEPRALRRCLELDGSLLVNRQLRCLASLLARLVPRLRRRLRLGRLLHATGFDIRPPRPTLEPSDLVALGINRSPKLGHFPKQLQHQIFEFGVRKAVKVKVGRPIPRMNLTRALL